ncbi:hypothetical protein GFC01_14395 [Desulfofundulus thermobenzoicus]|uniref:CGGC domain-containing protein n=1 Tax=Desulfofundulus thermobenzoicus TaxID=29376 RepID=A0A6N7ITI1_9FIRM|nr:hypothetical protein [Desulfofundulus thermobenzoicus]MQL53426.1 hypothetical protein [Desulfofundulus thermobenzoicus]
MLLAVAYCGGCNPVINREELVKYLEREMGQPIYSIVKMKFKVDVLILMNGCTRGCLIKKYENEWKGKMVIVAGHTIDFQMVNGDGMKECLLARVKEIAKLAENLS